MLTAAGVGSGLDLETMIAQLMQLERRPLEVLQAKQKGYEAQLSAFGQLKSALSAFQTAMTDLKSIGGFRVYDALSSNTGLFTAEAASDAAPGSYSVKVNNLAVAQKQASAAKASATTLGGVGDQITITIGANSFAVDAGGKTLAQIRDEINNASDNIGVTASLLTETVGTDRLILTSDNTGTANAMSLSFTGTVGTDLGMTVIQAAENAEVLVDNLYTITRGSNTISDAIQGVTLSLVGESATAATLTVKRDTDEVKNSVQKFVDAYNALRTTIDSQRAGKLKGDSTLNSLEAQIRNVLGTAPTGLSSSFNFLAEIGVTVLKDGKMSLNSTDLKNALGNDFNGVAQLFANDDQGYVFRLDSLVTSMLDSDGLVDARTDGIDARIKRVKTQIDNFDYRLERIEARFRKQFAALDTLMGTMASTSSFLSLQLAQLSR